MRKIFIGTLLFFVVFLEGMHAQCYSVSLDRTRVEFGYNGGTDYVYVTPPSGCPSATITVDNAPDWATVTISGTRVSVSCQPLTGGFREQSITIRVNGIPANGFNVEQGTEPPPSPCSVSGFTNATLNTAGENRTFSLTFSNCSFSSAYLPSKPMTISRCPIGSPSPNRMAIP